MVQLVTTTSSQLPYCSIRRFFERIQSSGSWSSWKYVRLWVVYVNSVTITYFQVIKNADTINHYIVTTYQMLTVQRALLQMFTSRMTSFSRYWLVSEHVDAGQKSVMGSTRRNLQFLSPWMQLRFNASSSGRLIHFQVLSTNPHHAFSSVGTWYAFCIDAFVWFASKRGVSCSSTVEEPWSAKKCMSGWNKHCSSACFDKLLMAPQMAGGVMVFHLP